MNVRGSAIARFSAVTLACVSLATLIAWGHQPIAVGGSFPTRDAALIVEDESISQVAYVELTNEAPEAWLRLSIDEPGRVFVSLGVPKIDRLIDYRPLLRLIGPVGENEAIVFETQAADEPRVFHEPFTDTDSWIHVESWVEVAEAGTYYVVASASAETADKVWISVGRREVFGIADVLSLPSIIRDVRVFHEVPPPSAIGLRDWAVLLAFLFVAGVVVYVATR